LRVLFWGTPEFAVAPLRALLYEGFEVVGAVTQTDKPQGRSRSALVPPPVKALALGEGIPVFQPPTPKDAEFLEMLGVIQPDISVVVAYGHILPKSAIDAPRLGTLNIHASLLPKLRGAAPIQAAVRQGFRETGVTIMRMVPALDAGPVILTRTTPVLDDETAGELAQRLAELGSVAIVEALQLIAGGRHTETPQDDAAATYAPKIEREHARVDWRMPAIEVSRVVRAFDPRPSAWTTLRGAEVKLFGARTMPDEPETPAGAPAPGTVTALDAEGMAVACGDGAVRLREVQPAGKRRMAVGEWARGRGIAVGDLLA